MAYDACFAMATPTQQPSHTTPAPFPPSRKRHQEAPDPEQESDRPRKCPRTCAVDAADGSTKSGAVTSSPSAASGRSEGERVCARDAALRAQNGGYARVRPDAGPCRESCRALDGKAGCASLHPADIEGSMRARLAAAEDRWARGVARRLIAGLARLLRREGGRLRAVLVTRPVWREERCLTCLADAPPVDQRVRPAVVVAVDTFRIMPDPAAREGVSCAVRRAPVRWQVESGAAHSVLCQAPVPPPGEARSCVACLSLANAASDVAWTTSTFDAAMSAIKSNVLCGVACPVVGIDATGRRHVLWSGACQARPVAATVPPPPLQQTGDGSPAYPVGDDSEPHRDVIDDTQSSASLPVEYGPTVESAALPSTTWVVEQMRALPMMVATLERPMDGCEVLSTGARLAYLTARLADMSSRQAGTAPFASVPSFASDGEASTATVPLALPAPVPCWPSVMTAAEALAWVSGFAASFGRYASGDPSVRADVADFRMHVLGAFLERPLSPSSTRLLDDPISFLLSIPDRP
jgi:hypothetical protein